MTADVLLSRLERVKHTGPGRWIARCPAHEDRRASLSIRELDDGRVLVHDFAGCAIEEVLRATGLNFDALFPPRVAGEHAAAGLRQPFPAADVLQALAYEITVIAIVAGDVEKRLPVSEESFRRLRVAIERLLAAREMTLGR